MGYHSEKMIEDAARYQWALAILCEVGAIHQCLVHGFYFNGSGDLTAAYKLANYRLTEDGGADPGDRRAMTDAIKKAYMESSCLDQCDRCLADD